MAQTIKFGSRDLNIKDLISNIENNVSSYLESHPEWSDTQKNLFKDQYNILKSGLIDQRDNDTDRFTIDEFGTITDKLGQLKNTDDNTNLIDANGNLITNTEGLSDKDKQKLTSFKASQQVANYLQQIGNAMINKQVTKSTEIPSYADYWQAQNDPQHELTTPDFWAKLDEKGKYTNRIKNTLDSMDEYAKKYNLSEEQNTNLNKLKELLSSTDVGSDTWKRNVMTQAAKMGLASWVDGYFGFNFFKDIPQQPTEPIPGNTKDYLLSQLQQRAQTDANAAQLYAMYQAHPNLRESIIKQLRKDYQQEETAIQDAWIQQENDAKWQAMLAKHPEWADATKRKYTSDQVFGNGMVNARKSIYPDKDSNVQLALKNLNKWLNNFKTHSDLFSPQAVNLHNQYGQKFTLKNYGEVLAYFKPYLDKRNKNGQYWWSKNFDKVSDKKGNEIYRLKNSKNAHGEYLYLMFGKNNKLYTYYSKPYSELYKEAITKAELGVKLISKQEKEAMDYNTLLPIRAKANNKTIQQQKAVDNTEFTNTDKARLAAIGADLASMGTSYIPGYGTAASAVLGYGSTLTNMGADLADGTDSTGNILWNTAKSLGMDTLGLIPGVGTTSKIGKISKTLIRYIPRILGALGTISSIGNTPEIISSFKKIITPGAKLSVQDYQNMVQGIQLITTGHNVAKRRISENINTQIPNRVGVRMTNKTTGESKTFIFKDNDAKTIRNSKDNQGILDVIKKYNKLKNYDLDQVNKVGVLPHFRWFRTADKGWQSPVTFNSKKTQIYDVYSDKQGNVWSNKEGIRGWLQPYGNTTTQVKLGKPTKRRNLTKDPETRFVDRQVNAARQEAVTNSAPNSLYQKTKARYNEAIKEARASRQAGNSTDEDFYTQYTQGWLKQLRALTPEYNKLRGMLSSGNNGRQIIFDNNGTQVVRNWQDIVNKYGLRYKQGGIIKAQAGIKTDWRTGIQEFDPANYKYSLDTSTLHSLDNNVVGDQWTSNQTGIGTGRYKTVNGYNRQQVQAIQNQDYYKNFTNQLLDSNGNFTEVGKAWARAVDANLPTDSQARFFDSNDNLRTKWTANNKDPYGRAPQVFTNLKDYVNYMRNDDLLGARHNVFINKGNRYYYLDDNKQRHYVNPNDISKYNVSKNGTNSWKNNVYWTDYEITGLKPESTYTNTINNNNNKTEELSKNKKFISPTLLYGIPRATLMDRLNRKIANISKTYPLLQQPVSIHRNIYSDYNSEITGYNNWAKLRNLASQPVTSDANLNAAQRLEANLKGAQYYQAGMQQSDQVARQSAEAAWQQAKNNVENAQEVANNNAKSIYESNIHNRNIEAAYLTQKGQVWDTLAQELQQQALTDYNLRKARTDEFAKADIKEQTKHNMLNPDTYTKFGLTQQDVNVWDQVVNGLRSTTSLTEAEKQSYLKVSKAATDYQNQELKQYFNIPNSQFYTPYKVTWQPTNILAKEGGKLETAYLRAASKDADRFYKTTKDFADRAERAIARIQETKKKKKKKI